MYIENMVGKWHLWEYLSQNFVALRKLQICAMQFSEKALMSFIPICIFYYQGIQ